MCICQNSNTTINFFTLHSHRIIQNSVLVWFKTQIDWLCLLITKTCFLKVSVRGKNKNIMLQLGETLSSIWLSLQFTVMCNPFYTIQVTMCCVYSKRVYRDSVLNIKEKQYRCIGREMIIITETKQPLLVNFELVQQICTQQINQCVHICVRTMYVCNMYNVRNDKQCVKLFFKLSHTLIDFCITFSPF